MPAFNKHLLSTNYGPGIGAPLKIVFALKKISLNYENE